MNGDIELKDILGQIKINLL